MQSAPTTSELHNGKAIGPRTIAGLAAASLFRQVHGFGLPIDAALAVVSMAAPSIEKAAAGTSSASMSLLVYAREGALELETFANLEAAQRRRAVLEKDCKTGMGILISLAEHFEQAIRELKEHYEDGPHHIGTTH